MSIMPLLMDSPGKTFSALLRLVRVALGAVLAPPSLLVEQKQPSSKIQRFVAFKGRRHAGIYIGRLSSGINLLTYSNDLKNHSIQ